MASLSAFQKPVVTKRFHFSSRASAAVAASVDELWKQSDLVIEGVVETLQPANHMSKDTELAFTAYTMTVTEFFKGSESARQSQQILIRRWGGRIEKRDRIELHESENNPAFKKGDRILAFLRRAEFTLPAFGSQTIYFGTSHDSPDSFYLVGGDALVTTGNSRAARTLSALDIFAAREQLRQRGGR